MGRRRPGQVDLILLRTQLFGSRSLGLLMGACDELQPSRHVSRADEHDNEANGWVGYVVISELCKEIQEAWLTYQTQR